MIFRIGDVAFHTTYGLGKIIRIEEKIIHGRVSNCYVFCTSLLTIWIPIDQDHQTSLRGPTLPSEFKKLFLILSGSGDSLPENRLMRRDLLFTRLRDGQLASVCKVVRDLTHFKRSSKLSVQEKSILEQATNTLLSEWTYALEIPFADARQTMETLLAG